MLSLGSGSTGTAQRGRRVQGGITSWWHVGQHSTDGASGPILTPRPKWLAHAARPVSVKFVKGATLAPSRTLNKEQLLLDGASRWFEALNGRQLSDELLADDAVLHVSAGDARGMSFV